MGTCGHQGTTSSKMQKQSRTLRRGDIEARWTPSVLRSQLLPRQISVIQRLARWYLYCFRQLKKARARRWKSKRTMGVCAHDVTTAFPSSSIAEPVATCRTGRGRPKSARHTGKRRRSELVNERPTSWAWNRLQDALTKRITQMLPNGASMDPSIAYLLISTICICLGLVTAKVANYRGVPGSAFLWFIAGTFLAVVALPAAIFFQPVRKSSSAKISLRADWGYAGSDMWARYVNFVSMKFEGRQSLHDQPMFSPAASASLISLAISRCSDAYERKMIMVNHLGTEPHGAMAGSAIPRSCTSPSVARSL